jgi:hypothetical protein
VLINLYILADIAACIALLCWWLLESKEGVEGQSGGAVAPGQVMVAFEDGSADVVQMGGTVEHHTKC